MSLKSMSWPEIKHKLATNIQDRPGTVWQPCEFSVRDRDGRQPNYAV